MYCLHKLHPDTQSLWLSPGHMRVLETTVSFQIPFASTHVHWAPTNTHPPHTDTPQIPQELSLNSWSMKLVVLDPHSPRLPPPRGDGCMQTCRLHSPSSSWHCSHRWPAPPLILVLKTSLHLLSHFTSWPSSLDLASDHTVGKPLKINLFQFTERDPRYDLAMIFFKITVLGALGLWEQFLLFSALNKVSISLSIFSISFLKVFQR